MAVSVSTVALMTGCTISGQPTRERLDLRSLVGGYSLQPLGAPSVASESYGRTLESVRMGEAAVDPLAVDPALTFGLNGFPAVPVPTPAIAVAFLAAPVRAVLEKRRMLAGFAIGASDRAADRVPAVGAARLLTVVLLRFPDADAARQAAEEIDAVDAAVSPENVAVTIPEYPAAHGHWRPNVPTIAASLAHESFVITLLAGHTAADLGALTGAARKVFDAQLPLLGEFAATSPVEFAGLPLDRDGMLSRMVPKAPGRWPYPAVTFGTRQQNAGWDSQIQASGVVYGPRATQLFRGTAKPGAPESIAFNGLDALVRFSNAAAARQSFEKGKKADTEQGLRGIAGPAGVPDISCTQAAAASATYPFNLICRILYGRYVATIFGRQLTDFQQRAAAQYAVLANSEPAT
ncbi:DUF7373 family lipoprotein [Nocardia anaemiae]|uniref:DUF7373 family lipoprotein n=1 Tax=Nocardia anaemiae TaxID=263910 RepID=UPI0012F4A6EB|nr:hypothetical protein [Nocardia anaemiae]